MTIPRFLFAVVFLVLLWQVAAQVSTREVTSSQPISPFQQRKIQATIYGLPSNNFFSFPFGYGYWKFEFQTSAAGYVLAFISKSNFTTFNSTRNKDLYSLIDVGTTDYLKSEYRFSKTDADYLLLLYNPLAAAVEFTKMSILQLYKQIMYSQSASFSTPALQSDYYFCPNCFSGDSTINFATDKFALEIAPTAGSALSYADLFIGVNKKATPNGDYDMQRRVTFSTSNKRRTREIPILTRQSTTTNNTQTISLENVSYPLASIYVSILMSGCPIGSQCGYTIRIIKLPTSTTTASFSTSGLIVGMVGVGLCISMSLIGSVTVMMLVVCYLKRATRDKDEQVMYTSILSRQDSNNLMSNATTNDYETRDDVTYSSHQTPSQKSQQMVGDSLKGRPVLNTKTVYMDSGNNLLQVPSPSVEHKSPKLEDKITSIKSSFLQRTLRMNSYLNSSNKNVTPVMLQGEKKANSRLRPSNGEDSPVVIQVNRADDLDFKRRQTEAVIEEYIADSSIDTYRSVNEDNSSWSKRSSLQEELQTTDKLKGRYCVEKVLGRGSFAIVYLAFDEKTNNHIAIKSIQVDSTDESRISIIREEGLRMIECKHDHIITMTDVFPCPILHSVCFVMHYYQHGDLKTVMDRNREWNFSQRVMMNIIQQLADALFYLHSKSIIHNDLKPSNVFVDEIDMKNEWVLVAIGDFGESQKYSPHQSNGNLLKGTEIYIAPEVLSGKGELSYASDIWSFGCTVYQLMTRDFVSIIVKLNR